MCHLNHILLNSKSKLEQRKVLSRRGLILTFKHGTRTCVAAVSVETGKGNRRGNACVYAERKEETITETYFRLSFFYFRTLVGFHWRAVRESLS